MMASPVLVPIEKEDEGYYYGQEQDKRLRRRAEWLQRYDWIIEPKPKKRKRKFTPPIPIKGKEYAGQYRYDFCVYFDCSDLAGGATFLVHTQYGTRCAEVLGTPVGNTLVCISCCGSPDHDDRRRTWWSKYAQERIKRERKRLAKSKPMTAALQAKMRKEWGVTT